MRQVAALPYRFMKGTGERLEILLVTSFRSKRWIIPKGNVDGAMPQHLAAAKEAEEEGGVRGRVGEQPIGRFCYGKERDGALVPTEVDVFPLEVQEEMDRWPEMDQRERRWLPVEEAARAVEERVLEAIIKSFRPAGSRSE